MSLRGAPLPWRAGKAYYKRGLGRVVVATQPAAARNEAVKDKGPERQPSVGMTNFLALYRRARLVRDGNFGDLFAHAAQLCGHFRTEFEAQALQTQLRQQRPANNFVTGRFVVNAGAEQQIGKVGQELGPQKEAQAALGTIGTYPIHDIRLALFERTQQPGIILRVIL